MNSRNQARLVITLLLRHCMFAVSILSVRSLPPRCQGKLLALHQLSRARNQMSMPPPSKRKVIVIAGPTAVGKSNVAARICANNRGLIVSADSVQAYRGVQIGANKPSAEEQLRNPHILVDIADHTDNYNAADWSRDAVFAIQSICGTENQEDVDNAHRKLIAKKVTEARSLKGHGKEDILLPVVCGGTMMYIQWLVHGRPDAMKPSAEAVQEADSIMSTYEARDDYAGAIEYVGSMGGKFAERAKKFCDRDFYRLRRTLEVALTVKGQHNEKELIESLYTGEREGDLRGLGYDVRCFFLCPDDRMKHTTVVDERCEQMIIKGLLKETTDLILSDEMPDMTKKAIGYRQALDYLADESDVESESGRFNQFLNDFSTATRRYAKQQMAWFRRDKAFLFVPVSLDATNGDRVVAASDAIQRYCDMSRDEYERERDSSESESTACKKRNEEQGSKMKFYQFKRCILNDGSLEFKAALSQALDCRKQVQSRKRRRVDDDCQTMEAGE